ncbi:TonB-dependent receptor plug domain-containing protein [Sphingoaurantiacus capsulatus]|uniref:TonB-dependent receptor plug domain-containing protein n=1 Tax=Sphingoaurantiacus capsulatus TaxID=1771310 RepID=A0ABV7X6X9_9SPHN
MKSWISRVVLPSVLTVVGVAEAHAQTAADAAAPTQVAMNDSDAEDIIVLGSRRRDRTIADSPVAIDVIQPEVVTTTGYTDVNDALRTLVPAFNAQRLPLNDGSSFVRPITLRASPSDHVLLLLNKKRRHRSAIVQIGTGHATTSGSQGQDFNVIPTIALSRIEVLRDGASAQYGSDAIAGVINLELKEDTEGGSIIAHMGQYYKGDGDTYDVQGNFGLPLWDSGFMNISAQYTDQKKTFRGGQPNGAAALRASGQAGVPKFPAELGEPDYTSFKTVLNAGLDLGGDAEAYFFANYMTTDSTVGFSYRQSRAAGGFPAHATFGNSAFDGTAAHPEIFDLTRIYPGGFVPQFTGDLTDLGLVGGFRDTNGPLTWDVSARLGKSKVDYTIANTINPSLGVRSPTVFKPGSLEQKEVQLDGEVGYTSDVGFASDLLVFGGVSYRKETYTIGAGDLASYTAGPLRDLPVGSNGFQGFSPNIAGAFDSSSYAIFAEADTDPVEGWNIALAARYEDYKEFGDNLSAKAATRFELSDMFAIRGSVSTGFRAPAAGQVFGTSQTSQIDRITNNFILDAVLIPGSPAAQIFGSAPLKPETSFNKSAGLVFQPGNGLLATLDFYQIDVDDRLLLTPSVTTTPAQRAALAALGFPNGASVQQVRYFQNKLDTRVRGFDFVTTYGFEWGGGNKTDLSLALNYNEQHLKSNPQGFYTVAQVIEFEEGTPNWRGNASVTNKIGDFNLMVRGTYYGSWKRLDGAANFLPRKAVVIWDAEIGYDVSEQFGLAVGARNVFDKYPPGRGPGLAANGIVLDNHSVFGLSGGYYYLSGKLRF